MSKTFARNRVWRLGAAAGGLLDAAGGVWIVSQGIFVAAGAGWPLPLWLARAIVLASMTVGALRSGIGMLKLYDRK